MSCNSRRFAVLMLLLSVSLTGCGLVPLPGTGKWHSQASEQPQEEPSGEFIEAVNNGSGADPEGAQAASTFYDQPWFEAVDFINEPPMIHGGVWYYTQAKHPNNLDDDFIWDEVDVLYIQLGDNRYRGYDAKPVALELINNQVARVTLHLEKKDDTFSSDQPEPARTYIKVNKGTLKGKSFLVVDESGRKLQTR
jgi:hypothetical protein